MEIDNELLVTSEARGQRAGVDARAMKATAAGAAGEHVRPDCKSDPARASQLRFAGAQPSETELERTLGTNDLVDEFFLQRALVAARPVCRLRFTDGGRTGHATGFLISPGLVLTNWHVFKEKASAEGAVAEFDYKLDIRGKSLPGVRFTVRPDVFFHSHKPLDYAMVGIDQRDDENAVPLASFGYHRLVPGVGKIREGEWISIIQHPAGGYRQFAIRENQLLQKTDDHLWYMSDTAPGSSGAPAFNDSFQVVALHHMGKAKQENGKYVLRSGELVDSLKGIDESQVVWVANEGIRTSVLVKHMLSSLDAAHPKVQELFTVIQSETGDIMSNALKSGVNIAGGGANESAPAVSIGAGPAGTAGLVIPLQLHITLTTGAATAPTITDAPAKRPVADDSELAQEAFTLKQPFIETPYSNRKGYNADFLGVNVPMPEITDLDLVSKLADGKHAIPYEHFSVVHHKARRMAAFVAWNVDGKPASRNPEPKPAGAYTRKGLTGLKDFEAEKWKTDPRIPADEQIPDGFYSNDGGAFDKGHVARREDLIWGSSYRQVRRANGDSFHVTNCVPQIMDFNRAPGIWGGLENFVLKQVKDDTDKYSVFGGPVLSDEDQFFEGLDEDDGELKIAIPSKFWKVVVATKNGALQAFGFLLEQSLTGVELVAEEFQVDSVWKPFMISLTDLEGLLGIVKFPQALKDADQFGELEEESLLTNGLAPFPGRAQAHGGGY